VTNILRKTLEGNLQHKHTEKKYQKAIFIAIFNIQNQEIENNDNPPLDKPPTILTLDLLLLLAIEFQSQLT
jgi:hypothetical protein